MIKILEVSSKKEIHAFVKFPFELYKDSKCWVPPIISEEINGFDKTKNPVFEHAEVKLFLAYKASKIVGRVAAIINWHEVNIQKVKKMRFGWLDFIDDLEVSKALFDVVETIGKQQQLEFTEGPVGFSNLDKVGVMNYGFENIGTMITWYNHPYYIKHYEAANYSIEKSYSENSFAFSDVDPENFTKIQTLIKKRYELTAPSYTTTKEIMPHVDAMFDLFNESYANLSSFVAISDIQKAYFKKKFISFVNPEYIKFVFDKHQNLVAFAIVLPAFAEALQKAKGKLFPFGFLHILKAKKYSKRTIFYLIGVHPSYLNKGLNAIIFQEYFETFKAKNINFCLRTPELDDNDAIHKIWKHIPSKLNAQRRTYKKFL